QAVRSRLPLVRELPAPSPAPRRRDHLAHPPTPTPDPNPLSPLSRVEPVKDLSGSLGEGTEVQSFHGLAKKLLHQGLPGTPPNIHYRPFTFIRLAAEDLLLIEGLTMDEMEIGQRFRSLEPDSTAVVSTLRSGDYYRAVGYDDSVFRVYRALRDNPDYVPAYAQVVVDEFQDFCALEVELIKALAGSSPTLIVGDDDQALYAFRDASPDAIRELAAEGQYQRFELPFCSRCTEVLVAATHTVVDRAKANGLLTGRLDKRYECYLPGKSAESALYPKIKHFSCSTHNRQSPYIGRLIAECIRRIPAGEIAESYAETFPTAMIIAPEPFRSFVEKYLGDAGFQLVGSPETNGIDDLVFAYRLLAKEPDSNFAWRIIAGTAQPDGWEEAVREAVTSGTPLVTLLQEAFLDGQRDIAALVAKAYGDEDMSSEDRNSLADALAVSVDELDDQLAPPEPDTPDPWDETKPLVMVTSLMGSKGLQAGHVFIAGINAGHFPRNNQAPNNEEVCQLLVALTRARKSCTLVSTRRLGDAQLGKSVFVDWLEPHIDQTVYANKTYIEAFEAS
ncbi:MAG: ATP-dependent helicase, partial [Acidimicrobiales bacterium]|nr:ATP-dependent helicase [Acidimicrobiales bacterium]